jgi:hypothetical protein
MSTSARVVGFTYYPLWEIAFGAFLIVCAIGVPGLFLRYNGLQAKHLLEWLFCVGFFLFFGWIGKNLVNQSFTATLEGGDLIITHNLREPPLHLRRAIASWSDTVVRSAPETGKPDQSLLILMTDTEAIELHRSVSDTEIANLREAFATLRQAALSMAAPSTSPTEPDRRPEVPDQTGSAAATTAIDATTGVPPGASTTDTTGSTTP